VLRTVVIAAPIVVASILAFVQIASAALFSSAGTPGSLPARLSPGMGARIYGMLDRVAPAPYVETMLAEYAIAGGDTTAAQRATVRLPASPMRNELLGRIADMRGDHRLALEYFLVAPDASTVQQEVDRESRVDPMTAYRLEQQLADRLDALTVHPDAVAEAYWRLGKLATQASYLPSTPQHPIVLNRARSLLAMRQYLRAVDLAPLNERYLLAAGSQALLLDDSVRARRLFQRGVDADPASADAYAGLGLVAVRAGDIALARTLAARSAALDPNAHILADLRSRLP